LRIKKLKMKINESMYPLISICIPTYNRKEFLSILLESIICQSDPRMVQIVVSDNASTDETSLLMDEVKKRYPNLIYHKAPKNMGADQNYLSSVEHATGKYCWLMGSDDALKPGSINHLLNYISLDLEIYLTGRTECSLELKPVKNRDWIEIEEEFKVFNFSKDEDLKTYFDECNSLGAVFSYLSSIIVKRSSWASITFDESFIGTAYSHVSILLGILVGGARLGYIKEPLVYSRSGNDSFLSDWTERTLLDLTGYKLLGEKIIANNLIRKDFYSIMRREHSPMSLIRIKIISSSKKWSEIVDISITTFSYSGWIFKLADILYLPGTIALYLKRQFKKIKLFKRPP
jgi:abequosyltransferase